MFYMQQRGIQEREAKALLMYAFSNGYRNMHTRIKTNESPKLSA
jgi:Fe-S cluster assembly scaffold protein SufB